MEHTNLFFYRDKAALEAAYPDGKVDVVPGVAYARGAAGENGTTLFNKALVKYEVTLLLKNKSGETVGDSETVLTKDVLEGQSIKLNIVAPEVENYKPRHEIGKIEVSADTEHTVIYLGKTAYTVTVHHVFEGEPIAEDTEIEIDDVWDESSVVVTVEPVSVAGYTAETHTLTVSGDCEYTLEYEKAGGYEAIDLGLSSGTLWCSCNVGASSPEQYGGYFAWGEIEPNKATAYTQDNYRFYDGETESGEYSKYNSSDGLQELELVDDAANVIMGGDWHIPTNLQAEELLNNTTSSWTTDYNGTGVAGVILTSTANTNSIFIPAAGGYWQKGPDGIGEYSTLWCQALKTVYVAYAFGFSNSDNGVFDVDRFGGVSVRGVIGEGPQPPQEPLA